MCWLCGNVRPGDGPALRQVTDQYDYLVGGADIFRVANPVADWESLAEWPEWEERDAAGEPFFYVPDAEESRDIGRRAYLYGLRVVLRLPMSDVPDQTRQIAERQFWNSTEVAAERGWPEDWLDKLIAVLPRHPVSPQD